MKKHLFLFIMIIATGIGCTDRDDNITNVNLRIKNSSDITFEEVLVSTEDYIYTDIAPGDYSDYLEFEELYSYAYINILSEGENYILQPIDFVGETPLDLGFYTYELDLDVDGQVVLNLVTD